MAKPIWIFLIVLFGQANAADIKTNSIEMPNAPAWLKSSRVERVTDRVSRYLEWDIRKIQVRWYSSEQEFKATHGFDSSVLAVTKRSDASIHLGPRVNTADFDATFGHELGHVILIQKYKNAIPKWLEEGLANVAAQRINVDYRFLAEQNIVDVRALEHPFGAKSLGAKAHYMASTALMQMISAKCRIHDLLQLSVGQGLEPYLKTFCRIEDLNAEYKTWVSRKSKLH